MPLLVISIARCISNLFLNLNWNRIGTLLKLNNVRAMGGSEAMTTNVAVSIVMKLAFHGGTADLVEFTLSFM